MEQRRRIGAYGLCRDGRRVLLARSSALADVPGVWQLPGGALEHAEHPADAVVRQFTEQTGLSAGCCCASWSRSPANSAGWSTCSA